MSDTNTTNLTVFFDTVGRTIIATKVSESDTQLVVKNPVIVHIVPNQQTGQMALQLLPAFFKEFQADKSDDTVWTYNKELIVTSEPIALDFRLQTQYQSMFSNIDIVTNDVVTPDQIINKNNIVNLKK